MRITSINQQSHKKNAVSYSSNVSQNNVNFKGISYFLIGLVARSGVGALKSTQKVKYINALQAGLEKTYDTKGFTETMRAISKTPDSFYDDSHQGWTLWLGGFYDREPEYINNLRVRALYHFSSIPETSRDVIQTKKEFLQSFMDNGHEISSLFYDTFKNLNDAIYSSLKIGIIDTCLYSKSYNRIRTMKDIDSFCFPRECNSTFIGQPFRDREKRGYVDSAADREENIRIALYNNLKLISTLDKRLYHNFIEQRRNTIEESKRILENYFDREIAYNGGPKELYQDYLTYIKPL